MNTLTPAELIRECLVKTGMTQREMSAQASIPEVTISRILRGHSDGSMRTLRKLHAFADSLPSDPPLANQPQTAA